METLEQCGYQKVVLENIKSGFLWSIDVSHLQLWRENTEIAQMYTLKHLSINWDLNKRFENLFKFKLKKEIFIDSHTELRHTINKYDLEYNKCI